MAEVTEIIQAPDVQVTPDPVPKLYKVLKDKGLYSRTIDEFKAKYSTPESIDRLYGVIKDQGLYTKSREDFQGQYFTSLPAPEPPKPKFNLAFTDIGKPQVQKQPYIDPANAVTPEQVRRQTENRAATGQLPESEPSDFYNRPTEAQSRHKEEVDKAHETLTNQWNTIDAEAREQLMDKLTKQKTQQNLGLDALATKPLLPAALQQQEDRRQRASIPQEDVEAYKQNEENQRLLLAKKAQALKAGGFEKEANTLQASIYALENDGDIDDRRSQKRVKNIEKLKDGKLIYDPVKKILIKPLSFAEAVSEGFKARNKSYDGGLKLAQMNKEEGIQYLNSELNSVDPDEPVGMPGTVASTIGGEGMMMGKAIGAGLVTGFFTKNPYAAGAAATAATTDEAALRSYHDEFVRTFAQVKSELRQDNPNATDAEIDSEAYDMADKNAKIAATIDAAGNAVMNMTGAKLGKEATSFRLGKNVIETLKNTGKGVTKFLKEGFPEGAKNAAAVAGLQAEKNLLASKQGIHRDTGEGVAESFGHMLAFHYAVGGVHQLAGAAKDIVLQGLSKKAPVIVNETVQNLVDDGTLTPEQGEQTIQEVDQHRALDSQIPDTVKDDATRIKIANKVKEIEAINLKLKGDETTEPIKAGLDKPLKEQKAQLEEDVEILSKDPKEQVRLLTLKAKELERELSEDADARKEGGKPKLEDRKPVKERLKQINEMLKDADELVNPPKEETSISVIRPEDNKPVEVVTREKTTNVIKPEDNNAPKVIELIKPDEPITDTVNKPISENEGAAKQPGIEEPIPENTAPNDKAGSEAAAPILEPESELKKMASDIPNSGKLTEYASKESIEKTHGESPENKQEITVMELQPAFEHGVNMINKAKEVYGEGAYVEKVLDMMDKETMPTSSKALMLVSLENDLIARKRGATIEAEKLGIQKLQDLVRSKSQAFARESSKTLNLMKLRRAVNESGFVFEKLDEMYSPKEKESKLEIEEALSADADAINKQAEENVQASESITPEVQKMVEEGIAKEIDKINKALPPDKKSYADKAIAALEKAQKNIRSKSYSDATGMVAVIDAAITTIKNAIKAGVAVSKAIELGVNNIKEKIGEAGWAKEGEFRKDMSDLFEKAGVSLTHSGRQKSLAEQTLIDNGFGREVEVKTKTGSEKRKILDWKKLAGEEGSPEKMKQHVEDVLREKGYTEEQVKELQDSLADQYNEIRASVIDKSITEINRRNKKTDTPDQKSAARKLSELYNYGLLDQDPVQYQQLMSTALGIKSFSKERFQQVKDLAEGMARIYQTQVNGRRLTDVELKSVLQDLDEKMRLVLNAEANTQGNFFLKAANIVRGYMDANQRFMLATLKQVSENPLSGEMQSVVSTLNDLLSKSSTPALRAQKRANAKTIFKNIVLEGGTGYGDVSTTFVNKGSLDAYINKMTDSQLAKGIMNTVIGKAHLDGADAFFKSKITEQNFANNLLKILQKDRKVDGVVQKGMAKQDALHYVSEKLTGQSFKDAQVTAKEIIDRVNSGDKKIVGETPAHVDRLANDIVKAALVTGGKISIEQVTAAYNASYRAAGRSLGHVANNFVSKSVQQMTGAMEKQINDAIKNKEYNNAAALTLASTFFRNVANPFVGGGTNWMVLKLEKNGLGLVSGLLSKAKNQKKIDLLSDTGMKELETALYESQKIRDKFMRGAVGAATNIILGASAAAVMDTDEFRAWRGRNPWATKYTDIITPEWMLATFAARDEKMGRYFEKLFSKNDAFSPSTKAVAGGNDLVMGLMNGNQDKVDKGFGKLGEAAGNSMGIALPWRMVRDAQDIWLGAKGGDPYKVEWKGSKSLMEGAMKNGLLNYIKWNIDGQPDGGDEGGGGGASGSYRNERSGNRNERTNQRN